MKIFFVITEILLLFSYVIQKKKDDKLNILGEIGTSITILFIYNTIICLVLSFLKVKIELYIFIVINIICILLQIINILRKKEYQKFLFKKIDLIYIIIVIVIFIILAYLNFGYPFNIKYESGDSAIHFLTSIKFAKEKCLMSEITGDDLYIQINGRKPLSYVNSGLAMLSFSNDLDVIECYNIFLIFEFVVLFLIWMILYNVLEKMCNNKIHNQIAFIISLISVLGYPLNSMLFGFEYQSIGLLIVISIISTILIYKEEIIDKKGMVVLLSILNLGLFYSYYMYAVYVYIAIAIYIIIINTLKKRKIISFQLIEILSIVIFIPSVIGYIYHINYNIYIKLFNANLIIKSALLFLILTIFVMYIKIKNKKFKNILKYIFLLLMFVSLSMAICKIVVNINTEGNYANFLLNSGFKKDGYIYMNFYSNIIWYFPLLVFLFINNLDNKKIRENLFVWLLFFLNLLFIVLLTCLYKKGFVSLYYIMKNYYVLWIITTILGFKALINIYNIKKVIFYGIISVYIILLIISFKFSNFKMDYIIYNNYENILSVSEIYKSNIDIIFNKKSTLNREELDILLETKRLDYSSNIEFIANETVYHWIYSLIGYTNKNHMNQMQLTGSDYLAQKCDDLWRYIDDADYIVYFNNDERTRVINKIMINKNHEIIFENNAGGIIKLIK